ncbi:4751_t:CDS:2, partial [Cetraspora pellucida]
NTVINQLEQTITNNNDMKPLYINDNTPDNSFNNYTTEAILNQTSTNQTANILSGDSSQPNNENNTPFDFRKLPAKTISENLQLQQ